MSQHHWPESVQPELDGYIVSNYQRRCRLEGKRDAHAELKAKLQICFNPNFDGICNFVLDSFEYTVSIDMLKCDLDFRRELRRVNPPPQSRPGIMKQQELTMTLNRLELEWSRYEQKLRQLKENGDRDPHGRALSGHIMSSLNTAVQGYPDFEARLASLAQETRW